jgi:hypothetical protein
MLSKYNNLTDNRHEIYAAATLLNPGLLLRTDLKHGRPAGDELGHKEGQAKARPMGLTALESHGPGHVTRSVAQWCSVCSALSTLSTLSSTEHQPVIYTGSRPTPIALVVNFVTKPTHTFGSRLILDT